MRDFFPYLFFILLIVALVNVAHFYKKEHGRKASKMDYLGELIMGQSSQKAKDLREQQRVLLENRAQRMRRHQQTQPALRTPNQISRH